MRTLVPQLPVRLLKRLGLEAGVSAGLISMKVTLPPDQSPSLIGALDQVIEMLAAKRLPRWRTDPRVRTGGWIQFDEAFRFGEAPPSADLSDHDLVYFVATDDDQSSFLLCGSRAHLLDKRQVTDGRPDPVAGYYTTALLDYARRLAALPDEAAVADPPRLAGNLNMNGDPTSDDDEAQGELMRAIGELYNPNISWTGHAVLAGHARVLAVGDFVLATPLYVEYSEDPDL